MSDGAPHPSDPDLCDCLMCQYNASMIHYNDGPRSLDDYENVEALI